MAGLDGNVSHGVTYTD